LGFNNYGYNVSNVLIHKWLVTKDNYSVTTLVELSMLSVDRKKNEENETESFYTIPFTNTMYRSKLESMLGTGKCKRVKCLC